MKPIWIVDDDASIRWVLEKALARENLETRSFSNAREALAALKPIRRKCWSPISACRASPASICWPWSRKRIPACRSSSSPPFPTSIPPCFVPGRRLRIPAQAVRHRQGCRADPACAGREPARSERESAARRSPEILGQAPAMQEVFRAIGRLARSNVTVLITGESGHRQGTRAPAPAQAQPARAAGRSSPSTPPRSRRTCSSPSSSATSAAPSPARDRHPARAL